MTDGATMPILLPHPAPSRGVTVLLLSSTTLLAGQVAECDWGHRQ